MWKDNQWDYQFIAKRSINKLRKQVAHERRKILKRVLRSGIPRRTCITEQITLIEKTSLLCKTIQFKTITRN